MSATRPEELHTLFAEAALRGDIDALMALYEPDAVGVDLNGGELGGRAAIREFLLGFLAAAGEMEGNTSKVVASDDLALLSNHWHAVVKGPDGQDTTVSNYSAEVARRQPDGTWLFALDCPVFVPGAAPQAGLGR